MDINPNEPWPPGTCVQKIRSKAGDTHTDGSFATVLDNLGPLTVGTILGNGEVIEAEEYGYFVKWSDSPVPTFIRGIRLCLARTN